MLTGVEHISHMQMLLLVLLPTIKTDYCPGHDNVCPPPERCCNGGSMCCTPSEPKSREPADVHNYDSDLQFGVWNLWYFWFVVIFLFMACTGACAFWRHRRRLLMAEHAALATVSFGSFVPPRRYHCPPSQLSSEPSRASLNRFSYFSTVLASSPSTQEPQGEFPSPPPYSEITSKSSVAPGNSYWKDLPPYPGDFSIDLQASQVPGDNLKDNAASGKTEPFRMSNMLASPPSYSVASGTTDPPKYTSDAKRNQPAGSFLSLASAPSIDSGEELLPETTGWPNNPS